MIEFKVTSRKATMGKMKGKTVYIAVPKGQQKLSPEMILERIVRETSLSEGDAGTLSSRCAILSLSVPAWEQA